MNDERFELINDKEILAALWAFYEFMIDGDYQTEHLEYLLGNEDYDSWSELEVACIGLSGERDKRQQAQGDD